MRLTASGALVAMKHRAVELVNKVKIVPLFHGKQMKANNLHMCRNCNLWLQTPPSDTGRHY
jgi:hypothetical protein